MERQRNSERDMGKGKKKAGRMRDGGEVEGFHLNVEQVLRQSAKENGN